MVRAGNDIPGSSRCVCHLYPATFVHKDDVEQSDGTRRQDRYLEGFRSLGSGLRLCFINRPAISGVLEAYDIIAVPGIWEHNSW